MNLYNPEYLQNLCRNYHLAPSKKYGQNYLIDETVVEKIIEVGKLSSNDIVLEVGPGFGVLTEALAPRVQKVFAFEIEKKLQSYWENQQKKLKNIEIIWGNVLHEVPSPESIVPSLGSYKVISNLPYQITSPVIRLFLELAHPPELMVLMVQKEVGERICARVGGMSVLSLAVQYYAQPEYIMTVPRTAFWPSPAVDSAIITLRKLPEARLNPSSTDQLFKLIKAGFSSRRKVLRKNLEGFLGKDKKDDLRHVFQDLSLNSEVRAQELSVEEWITLFKKII